MGNINMIMAKHESFCSQTRCYLTDTTDHRRRLILKPVSSGMKITAGLTLLQRRQLKSSVRCLAFRRRTSISNLTISKPGRWAARSLIGIGTGEYNGSNHSDNIHRSHDGPVL